MTDMLEPTRSYEGTTSGAPEHAPEEIEVVIRGPKEHGAELDSTGSPSSTFWGFSDLTVNHGFARTLVFSPNAVNAFSQVAVSITELTADGTPFLGLAIMNVDNVVPQAGRVTVRGDVHWDSPLRVRLNFIVVN